MFKEKRIPTILGLLILIGGTFVGVFLTSRNTNTTTKASGDCTPQNPQITNITNNSVSIFFTTDSDCLSSLSINGQTLENIAISNSNEKSKVHYFDVSNLSDSSEYKYSLINNGKNYDQTSYKFKTANKPNNNAPSSNLAWGRVFTQELKAAAKVVVFVNIPGASPLSALVTSSGNWNISLANSFNESLNSRFTPPKNTTEEIIVIDKNKQATQISANTSQNNPTPDIILGQNKFSEVSVNYNEDNNTGSLSGVNSTSNPKSLDILNPKDSESISTQKPDFFGTGPNNTTVKIEVHSDSLYSGETTTNNDGSWNWSPPSNLSPGEHTITATINNGGVIQTITRKFYVLASDGGISYTASPSAKTTITPTLTPTPTTKITPTPTKIPSPTSIPTIKTSKPSTNSGMPATGNFFPTIILILVSLFFISIPFLNFKKK